MAKRSKEVYCFQRLSGQSPSVTVPSAAVGRTPISAKLKSIRARNVSSLPIF